MKGCPRKYPQLTKEVLYQLYWQEEKSMSEIGIILNAPEASVGKYFKYYNIPRRNPLEYHAIAIKHGIIKGNQITLSKEELYNKYWQEKKSLYDIARELGCSPATLHYRMRKLNIPLRNTRQHIKLTYDNGNRLKRKRYQKPDTRYIMVLRPTHPRANKHGYIAEHLEVWEQANGKSLPDDWVIHHINGIKDDNRPENLAGMPSHNHHGFLVDQVLKKRIRELEVELKTIKSQGKLNL